MSAPSHTTSTTTASTSEMANDTNASSFRLRPDRPKIKVLRRGVPAQEPVEPAVSSVMPAENDVKVPSKATRATRQKKSLANGKSLDDPVVINNQPQDSSKRIVIIKRPPTPTSPTSSGEESPGGTRRPTKLILHRSTSSGQLRNRDTMPTPNGDEQADASSTVPASRPTWATKTVPKPEIAPDEAPATRSTTRSTARSKSKSPTFNTDSRGLMEIPVPPGTDVTPAFREIWANCHKGATRPDGSLDCDAVIHNLMTYKGGVNAKWPQLEEYERAVAQMRKGTINFDKIRAAREEEAAREAEYRRKKELYKPRGQIAREKAAKLAALKAEQDAATADATQQDKPARKRKRDSESDSKDGESSQEDNGSDSAGSPKKTKIILTHKNRGSESDSKDGESSKEDNGGAAGSPKVKIILTNKNRSSDIE